MAEMSFSKYFWSMKPLFRARNYLGDDINFCDIFDKICLQDIIHLSASFT